MKKLTYILIGIFLALGVSVYAAPSLRYERTLLPLDSSENIGTSTARWAEGWFDKIDSTLLTAGTVTFTGYAFGDVLSTGCGKFGNTSTTTICGDGNHSWFQGRLGVGSSTPWAMLGVTSTSTIDTDAAFVVEDSASPDTSPFIVLNTGSVGVGVINPHAKLEVKHGATTAIGTNMGIMVSENTGAVNTVHQIGFGYNDGSQTYSPAVIGGIEESSTASTAEGLFFATRSATTDTAPTERMRITSGGNVGIGTTTPVEKLNLYGTAVGGMPKIQFSNDNQNNTVIGIGGNYLGQVSVTDDFIIRNDLGSILFGFNGIERMRIDRTNGNLGIGTTTPLTTLSVAGSAYIGGWLMATGTASITGDTVLGSSLLTLGSTTLQNFTASNATTTNATTTNLYFSNLLTGPQLFLTDNAQAYQIILNRSSATAGSWGWFVNSSGHLALYDRANNVNYMTVEKGVDANTLYLNSNGNVGIGTTGPATNLEISAAVTGVANLLRLTNTTAVAGNNVAIQFKPAAVGTPTTIIAENTGSNTVDLAFNTTLANAVTNAMIIKGSGNVGIGTTTPGANLAVWGNTLSFGGTDNNPSTFYKLGNDDLRIENWGRTTDTGAVNINYNGYQGGTTVFRDFGVYNGKSAIALFVDGSAGYTGIGTATPGASLHVFGNTANGGGIFETNWSSTDPFEVSFRKSRAAGADTAATDDIIDLAAYKRVSGTLVKSSFIRMGKAHNGTAGQTGDISFWTGNAGTPTEKMRIAYNGNVGIGTTSPRNKLHVSNDPPSAGTVATTTVEIGSATSTSRTCFNISNTTGDQISFFFSGIVLIVENGRCK